MTKLRIDLRDGFSGDAVAIRLDGREVYRREGLTTDLRISRADGLEVEAPEGGAALEVETRGGAARLQLDPAATPHVAVDLDPDGRPAVRASAEPFAFL